MAETDWHRDLMFALIKTLEAHFAANPKVYVSGNLLVFYEPGNKLRHLSPDVFVVKGIAKRQRPNYLIWEEGKGPDVVIELTSPTTKEEDLDDKFLLYRDKLRVKEYFLFDPLHEYLNPPLQGYRLRKGVYEPISPVDNRLPSKVLGLHLERNGREVRLYDPDRDRWLPTPEEALQQSEEKLRRETKVRREEARIRREEAKARQVEAAARQKAEAEVERLQRELEDLQRRLGSK
jgi:Uma2 family endonuclease